MTKSIVTGGAGFIGSHMTDRLLAEGHEVVVIDNFSTGRPENLETIKPLFKGADRVFHFAALADIVPSIVNPVAYYRSNVLGTMNVLEAARLAGVKRFLYTASSSCYGLAKVAPTPETADIDPMYPYALTKYLGEQTALHWHKVYGLPVVALRLFNVYGPRSRTSGTYGAVFGVFLAQKLAGKPFTVVGDGTQTRDFVFVTDVADAFFTASESSVAGEAMNVGSGGTYSINRLTDLLGGEKIFVPKRPGEPDCTFADVTKIQKLLHWKAKVSFEQGVAEVVKNIDYWRKAPVWTPETIADATKDWFKYLSK